MGLYSKQPPFAYAHISQLLLLELLLQARDARWQGAQRDVDVAAGAPELIFDALGRGLQSPQVAMLAQVWTTERIL